MKANLHFKNQRNSSEGIKHYWQEMVFRVIIIYATSKGLPVYMIPEPASFRVHITKFERLSQRNYCACLHDRSKQTWRKFLENDTHATLVRDYKVRCFHLGTKFVSFPRTRISFDWKQEWPNSETLTYGNEILSQYRVNWREIYGGEWTCSGMNVILEYCEQPLSFLIPTNIPKLAKQLIKMIRGKYKLVTWLTALWIPYQKLVDFA